MQALLPKDGRLILIGSLAGGTAAGAIPLLTTRLAKQQQCEVFVLVTDVFKFEGKRKQIRALLGLKELLPEADLTLLLSNQTWLEHFEPQLAFNEALNIRNAFLCAFLQRSKQTTLHALDLHDLVIPRQVELYTKTMLSNKQVQPRTKPKSTPQQPQKVPYTWSLKRLSQWWRNRR